MLGNEKVGVRGTNFNPLDLGSKDDEKVMAAQQALSRALQIRKGRFTDEPVDLTKCDLTPEDLEMMQ